MRIGMVVGATALAVLASCGGGYGSNSLTPTNNGPGGSTSSSVSVVDNSFSPNATTVTSGTKVTWTWGGVHSHNVTFDDGVASVTQTAGSYTRTFTAAGTYNYHCTIHGAAMSGSVTVK